MRRASTSYRQIAAELRRRIQTGALLPGDRAPSTRALAKRFHVANATAAHALQLLIQEGLLSAIPRSGTIVAGLGSAKDPEHELTRDRVVAAAIEIADEEGLPALSIRGLAAKLDVSAMSLYRHVENKDALIALMTEAALGEETLPATASGDWRAQLRLAARLEWKIMRRHPWLARVVNISRPTPAPNAIAYADFVMRALDHSALDATGKLEVHVVIHGFIQGLAGNVEAEAQAIAETGISEEEHMEAQEARFQALAATGRFPYFAKMMSGIPHEFELDYERVFERGLTALLDGIAPRIEPRDRVRPMDRR